MNNVDRRSLSDLALASHTTSFHLDFFSTRNLASRLDQLFSSFFFLLSNARDLAQTKQPTNLPGIFSPKTDSPALIQQGKNDLIHPSFLPPCEHGDDGDMHAHAFGKLSFLTFPFERLISFRPPLAVEWHACPCTSTSPCTFTNRPSNCTRERSLTPFLSFRH